MSNHGEATSSLPGLRSDVSLHTMKRSRRFAAVAAVLLPLQLLVLAGGAGCALPAGMPEMVSGTSPAMVAMGSTRTSKSRDALSDATNPSGNRQEPCRIPWAPANCNGMAPCAPLAVLSTAIALSPAPVILHDDVHLVVHAPASISTPPELPPPRA